MTVAVQSHASRSSDVVLSGVVHYTPLPRFHPATDRPVGQSLAPPRRARLVELTLVGRSRSGKQIYHADWEKKRRRRRVSGARPRGAPLT